MAFCPKGCKVFVGQAIANCERACEKVPVVLCDVPDASACAAAETETVPMQKFKLALLCQKEKTDAAVGAAKAVRKAVQEKAIEAGKAAEAVAPTTKVISAAPVFDKKDTCFENMSECTDACPRAHFGANCDTKKFGTTGQSVKWCCHMPAPGCYNNANDAATPCKVPTKEGGKKMAGDMTKCGDLVYCCDKCPSTVPLKATRGLR